jgi:hypothetical protein
VQGVSEGNSYLPIAYASELTANRQRGCFAGAIVVCRSPTSSVPIASELTANRQRGCFARAIVICRSPTHSQEVALTPTTQPFPWLTRPPLLVVYGRQLLACHSPPSRLPQLTRRLVAGCWPSGRPGTTAGHHLRGSPCGIRRGSGFLRSLPAGSAAVKSSHCKK